MKEFACLLVALQCSILVRANFLPITLYLLLSTYSLYIANCLQHGSFSWAVIHLVKELACLLVAFQRLLSFGSGLLHITLYLLLSEIVQHIANCLQRHGFS